ncbi:hypothetical protein ACGF0D_34070 [Kitasatospora sp. NPDC048298]|uniref:hypothetical protein n=1 Tax=Kitasatospora sp. NPDC048298 TaxID=3364049 RepID=UPI003721D1B0
MSENQAAKKSSLSVKIGWLAGIVAAIAAALTLYFTLWPKPSSIGEWKSKATSVCNQDARDVKKDLRSAQEALAVVYQDAQVGSVPQGDFNSLTDAVNSLAGDQQKLVGDLQAIPRPGSNHSDVDTIINEQAAGSQSVYRASADLGSANVYDPNSVTVAVQAASSDLGGAVSHLQNSQQAAGQLGVSCSA